MIGECAGVSKRGWSLPGRARGLPSRSLDALAAYAGEQVGVAREVAYATGSPAAGWRAPPCHLATSGCDAAPGHGGGGDRRVPPWTPRGRQAGYVVGCTSDRRQGRRHTDPEQRSSRGWPSRDPPTSTYSPGRSAVILAVAGRRHVPGWREFHDQGPASRAHVGAVCAAGWSDLPSHGAGQPHRNGHRLRGGAEGARIYLPLVVWSVAWPDPVFLHCDHNRRYV
jgi:hypothetical protein